MTNVGVNKSIGILGVSQNVWGQDLNGYHMTLWWEFCFWREFAHHWKFFL